MSTLSEYVKNKGKEPMEGEYVEVPEPPKDSESEARRVTKVKYPNLDAGFERLKDCLYNPSEYAVDEDLRDFFYVLAATFSDDENARIKSKFDVLQLEKSGFEESIKDNEATLKKLSVDYNQLLLKLGNGKRMMDNLDKKRDLTMEERVALQVIIEDGEAFEGRMGEIEASNIRISNAIKNERAQLDMTIKEIAKAKKEVYTVITNPTHALLRYMSQGGNLDIDGAHGNLSEMKALINAGYKDDALSRLKSVLKQPGETYTSLLLTEHRGVVNTSSSGDIRGYLNTESAIVMQNVYNLAKTVRSLNLKHLEMPKQDVQYRLFDGNVITEENSLHREVYMLHLITLAGYHPINWAAAFGLPISGIGKRVLDKWESDKLRPLTAGDLRDEFSESLSRGIVRSDASLDYTEFAMDAVKKNKKEVTPKMDPKPDPNDKSIPMPAGHGQVMMLPSTGMEPTPRAAPLPLRRKVVREKGQSSAMAGN
jgi:hypothetical protein